MPVNDVCQCRGVSLPSHFHCYRRCLGVTVTVAFASQLQLGLFSELIPLIVAPLAASGTISVTLVAPMVFGIDSPSAISFPLRWTSCTGAMRLTLVFSSQLWWCEGAQQGPFGDWQVRHWLGERILSGDLRSRPCDARVSANCKRGKACIAFRVS